MKIFPKFLSHFVSLFLFVYLPLPVQLFQLLFNTYTFATTNDDLKSNNNRRLQHLNDFIDIKCSKYSPYNQPEPLVKGRLYPFFHAVYAKFQSPHLNTTAEMKTHQTRRYFSNFLLFSFFGTQQIVASVSCSYLKRERHSVQSSTAVDPLLQGKF